MGGTGVRAIEVFGMLRQVPEESVPPVEFLHGCGKVRDGPCVGAEALGGGRGELHALSASDGSTELVDELRDLQPSDRGGGGEERDRQ